MDQTERQEAILCFIYDYLIKNIGRPPTLKDMLRARVGEGTEMGVITSTSILGYNLRKLYEDGQIILIPDGTSRNIQLPGSVFGIARFWDKSVDIMHWDVILIDIDNLLDGWIPNRLRDKLWDLVVVENKAVYTVSNIHRRCTFWDDHGLPQMHESGHRPYEIFLPFAKGVTYFPDNTAVVSDRPDLRLTAVGFGCALYSYQEAFGFTPEKNSENAT